jgi:hypothetical protein
MMHNSLLTFAAIALLQTMGAAQSSRPARTAIAPASMQGCWEMTLPNGEREWIIVGPSTARGQLAGAPAFANAPLRRAGRLRGGLGPVVRVVTSSPGARRPTVYSMWMEDTNYLRIGGYWEPEVAEPDPEFTRCA